MSVIYLTHPTHGAKVAISEDEAIFDESYGWERYTLPTSAPATAEDENDDDVELVNEMAVPKRRGRPRSKQED